MKNTQFSVECDDGAEFYLNDEKIIDHKTKSLIESFKYTDSKQPANVDAKAGADNVKINPNKSTSRPLNLVAGVKVRIMLKYFHSVHTSVTNSNEVFVKLYWESDDFQETLIPQKYLYSNYFFSPLKITGYNPAEATLRKLHEGDSLLIIQINILFKISHLKC